MVRGMGGRTRGVDTVIPILLTRIGAPRQQSGGVPASFRNIAGVWKRNMGEANHKKRICL